MTQHFHQIRRGGVDLVAERYGLDYDEASLLLRLTVMAFWRTGEVHAQKQELAERLGLRWYRLSRLLDRLTAKGVVDARFPGRGHDGLVTLLVYADLVKVPDDMPAALLSGRGNREQDQQDDEDEELSPGRENREQTASRTTALVAKTADRPRAGPRNRVYASRERSSALPVAEGDEENDGEAGHALRCSVPCTRHDVRKWDDGNSYCPRCEPMEGQPIEGVPAWT